MALFKVEDRISFDLMREIRNLPDGSTLDIDSFGGNTRAAQLVTENIDQRGFTAVIQDARSAAAIIALGCCRRYVVNEGKIVLHLGSIPLTGTTCIDGSFDHHVCFFMDLVSWQIRWLEHRFPLLTNSREMQRLKKDNRVEIHPYRALKLGLVHEVCEFSPVAYESFFEEDLR